MKQEFFNLEIKTNGQKLYEFTEQTIEWIKQNKFNNGILNIDIPKVKSKGSMSKKIKID